MSEQDIMTCRYFGICGGCRYMDRSYRDSLAVKEKEVKELFEQILKDRISDASFWLPVRQSPRYFGYRNKMEFSFGDACKDGPLCLGMHKKGSFHDIVTVDGCLICDSDFSAVLRQTLAFFSERKTAYYHRKRHDGYLRHLLMRKALHTGEILVDLVTASPARPETGSMSGPKDLQEEKELLEEFSLMLQELPLEGKISGILHTVNDSLSDTIKDEGTRILFGRDSFTERLLGLEFEISPFSFFQTNSFGAEVLYDTVREFAKIPGKRFRTIYDLYCGTGTIAQIMSGLADEVYGIEIVGEAVEAARKNAGLNHIGNCTFLEGDVLTTLDALAEKPEMIILDPPRDGIHPKALPKILAYEVPYIIYVSCKAKSLARDLPAFLWSGYEPVKAVCVDEFPWTANTETVMLLRRI